MMMVVVNWAARRGKIERKKRGRIESEEEGRIFERNWDSPNSAVF
jgi:hypothetical protein